MDRKVSFNQAPHQSTPAQYRPPSNNPPAKNSRKELFSTLAVIIMAPIVALLLTAFVFQSYEVDGPSMETTLSDNDRLIVNKTGKTWSSIIGSDFTPERYEIIIFTQRSSTANGTEEKQLIKRVIGLPGDRIAISGGQVTVYNDENPDGLRVDQNGPQTGITGLTEGNLEQTINEGEVFVLGDNRNNSLDSRVFGPIKSKDIVGTLSVRIFPFDNIKKF